MLNLQYLAEKFAHIWAENPQKLFKSQDQMQVDQAQAAQQAQQEAEGASPGAGAVSPRVNLPSAEKAAGQSLRTGLGIPA